MSPLNGTPARFSVRTNLSRVPCCHRNQFRAASARNSIPNEPVSLRFGGLMFGACGSDYYNLAFYTAGTHIGEDIYPIMSNSMMSPLR